MTRMAIPVRGINCDHLQCFDLESYLIMNQQSSVWKCPFCSKPCYSLQHDPLIQILIDSVNKLLPLKKYLNATREQSLRLLLEELKMAESDLEDQDMKNDISTI